MSPSRSALLGTMVLAGALFLFSPRLALSPGPLTAGHVDLADRCLACHTLLRGAPAGKCVDCHALDSIGVAGRAAAQATPRPALAGMHAGFRGVDCVDCHTDHQGDGAATVAFSHDALSPALRARCGSCHAGERPADQLHRQVGDDCATCHVTRAWSPASFAHDRYFVLDRDHDVACRTCHAATSGYAAYTCYGCHEHTEARIIAEHREEGIGNLADCARCHRSAREHEGGGEGRAD